MKPQSIRLEPRKDFDPCIVRIRKDGIPVYSWSALVNVCSVIYGLDEFDAMEWVDYNIVGLEPNGLKVSMTELPRKWKPRTA